MGPFSPFKINFSDAHISGAKGRCRKNFAIHIEGGSPTLANAHLSGDGSVSSNFLTPKIRKLAKNLVYFGLYRRNQLGGIAPNYRT